MPNCFKCVTNLACLECDFKPNSNEKYILNVEGNACLENCLSN